MLAAPDKQIYSYAAFAPCSTHVIYVKPYSSCVTCLHLTLRPCSIQPYSSMTPQVADMKAEVTKLKDELAPVYKVKARLTEELMQCRETLGRVRDINEKHSKALDEATGRIRDLQTRNKELSQQVDSERATQAVAASELEVSESSL